MNRNAAATIVALGVTALAAVLSWPAYRFAQAARPAQEATPTAPVTATLTATATLAVTSTPTLTPVATPGYVYLQVDGTMRVDACQGLAQVVGTVPPPLAWCNPVDPCDPCPPGGGDVGQGFLLWPGIVWRYRVYQDDTPTPEPTATPEPTRVCEVVYIIVTATPVPTDTPTPTITPDAIATYVAGTLTALAPTATGTPRPTETAEPTPTARVWRLTLFPLLQNRPVARGRR